MYLLKLKSSVKKDFKKVDKSDLKFIKDSLFSFVANFSSTYENELIKTGKIKKMQGEDKDIYRLKLRTYRVIYKKENDKLIILVVSVKSRENSYKK